VETFWRHDVTGKPGCFLALERSDFSKNFGILQLTKMGPFGGICSWLGVPDWLVGPDHWKYSLDEKVVNMIYIFVKIYVL
jgi:hypothetical protein